MELLATLQQAAPGVSIIFLDQEITAGEAVQLVRNGAYHCFCPADTPESVRQTLERAVDERRRHERHRDAGRVAFAQWLVGSARAMESVADTISLVGPRKCTVLITGETGTGKEMAARAIHAASDRSQRAIVAVNCSALPENLLEAELFGHVKGAFTGATGLRIGRFEQAHRSTIFLDEIGEMPLELQAKLLRVLQEREIQRLGSSETIKVDVRVVAATNVDLLDRVRQGKFREDLYYRLNVVPLRMPPLRERRTDVPLLVDHFVSKVCRAEGIAVKSISDEAKDRLTQLPWPGNVRQLENLIEATIALSGDRETLFAADFGLIPSLVASKPMGIATALEPLPAGVTFETAVTRYQRALLHQALAKAQGNKTAAAEILGMKRTTLVMKLRGLEECGSSLRAAV
jgi:DNA-binding NtrC family response regulator